MPTKHMLIHDIQCLVATSIEIGSIKIMIQNRGC